MEYLRLFFPQILKYVDYSNLSPFLVSEQLLTLTECDKLRKCGDRSKEEQNGLLVSILQRKGRNVYPLFYKALQRSVAADDLSCHLGHVELLQILPKLEGRERERLKYPEMVTSPVESLATELSQCVSLVKGPRSAQRAPLSFPTEVCHDGGEEALTDSGVLNDSSYDEEEKESSSDHVVEKDSPRYYKGKLNIPTSSSAAVPLSTSPHHQHHVPFHPLQQPLQGSTPPHWTVLSHTLSVVMSSWERVQEEMIQLSERNMELLQLMTTMNKERNEVQYCMRNCLKLLTDCNKYPVSTTIQRILTQTTVQLRQAPSTVSLLLLLQANNGLTEGESLHTCSSIISSLFGMPIATPSLKLCSPIHFTLFNNDVLQVTIIDTQTRVHSFKQVPDLVIGVTNTTSNECPNYQQSGLFGAPQACGESEIQAWTRCHDLSQITVTISLDHCGSFHTGNNNLASHSGLMSSPLPIEEERGPTTVHHILPIHHHLLCLTYHLSMFFVDCVERSMTSLRYTLVDCNRLRLKKTSDICPKDLLNIKDDLALYEMDLYCY